MGRIAVFDHVTVLGGGRRLFGEGINRKGLKFVGAKPFSTGVVVLSYQPAEKPIKEWRQVIVASVV